MSADLYFVYNPRSINAMSSIEISMPFIPDTVKYSYSPNFQEQSLLGRTSPVFLYQNGSKKTYGFSIVVHEDILNEATITKGGLPQRPRTLIELVDYLKMLAYPISENSIIFFPQVYFQLGELAGYGIVNVSVDWKKPFRDMRYINATVSFEVTIETPVRMPTEPSVRSQQVGFESLVYDYKIRYDLTQDQAEDVVRNLGSAYTGSVEDFIRENDFSDNVREVKRNIAIENFDYQAERIKNIYDTFKTSTGLEIISDLEIFNTVTSLKYEDLITPDKTEAEQIKDIKDAFRTYLDYYYNNERTTMTRDEYFQVLDSVFLMLERLQEYAEEIYGYGASG